MTDEQIVKASMTIDNTLAFIKRKQAEIERLRTDLEDVVTEYDAYKETVEVALAEARAEAIREFAERLKANASRIQIGGKYDYEMVTTNYIDYLAKEMTEGRK